MKTVYLFNGSHQRFPSGVFSSKEEAEQLIRQHALTGLLTEYPLDVLPYELAVEMGIVNFTKSWQTSPAYIEGFSNVGRIHGHWHYTAGVPD
jgi:hypothetical protein